MMGGDVVDRGEGVFEDHAAGAISRGQIDGHRSAERATDEKELAEIISGYVDDFGADFDEHGEAEVQGESDRVDEAGAAAGAAAAEADKAEEEAPAAA